MNYENLISIVMPVFNAQAYLEEALESVRRRHGRTGSCWW